MLMKPLCCLFLPCARACVSVTYRLLIQ